MAGNQLRYDVYFIHNYGCLDALLDRLCSWLCILFWIFIIILAIIGFLTWLIVRPNKVNITVTNASLTQFNFANSNTLHYDLVVNITIRNPNGRLGIYYDDIKTLAFYKDVRFGSQTLGTFFQHRKSTSFLNPNFKGQQVVPLNSSQISEFDKENKDGVFDIDVKLLLNVRFKFGLFKIRKAKPKVHCDLKVPLISSNGKLLGNGFQATDCYWDYDWPIIVF
jgi:hypothetical protein